MHKVYYLWHKARKKFSTFDLEIGLRNFFKIQFVTSIQGISVSRKFNIQYSTIELLLNNNLRRIISRRVQDSSREAIIPRRFV